MTDYRIGERVVVRLGGEPDEVGRITQRRQDVYGIKLESGPLVLGHGRLYPASAAGAAVARMTPPTCPTHPHVVLRCPACTGRKGGKVSSPVKTKAARRNARKPRPRGAP
jgi:hypothetical protein